MRKLLLKIITSVLAFTMLVSGLIACDSASKDWTKPTLKNWGEGKVVGGFIGETENYIYFINGLATSTDNNAFGAPVKGALMVQDKSDLEKAPQIVVPKLFASTDYGAGVYIYGGYAYYGTPSTDKNSEGNTANDEMAFMRTKLDGSDSKTFFTVGSLAINFRILENDGIVYIVYYDTANSTLYSYNTDSGERMEIIKTDVKIKGENAISLKEFKFLDNDAVEDGFAVIYSAIIYDEDYYEEKAKEDDYERATKTYNEVYAYGVFDDKVESKKIFDGATDNLTYGFYLENGTDIYATATDAYKNIDNFVYSLEDQTFKSVPNIDAINKDNLILEDGYVITLNSGVVKLRNAFDENDKANQKVIAVNENITSLAEYDEDNKILYFYNQGNSLYKIETENEDAVEVLVSEDMISKSWYKAEFIEINETDYVFYLDSSTKGSSYVKYVNLEQQPQGKDTDEDGENDSFYFEGHKFLAQRTNADLATFVTSAINDIMYELDENGALKFEEDNGALTVKTVVETKALFDEQTDEVKALIADSAKETLGYYVDAIKWANKYNTLKDARNLSILNPEERLALENAYNAVKAEIEEFKKSKNYNEIRGFLGNDLNAHYQRCVNEFEAEEA